MEKITKKKKTKKGLKKRIGLFAIGGLSLVLTICLSVGATLAWFAGSSWASNQLYMGGPVYVEMAGRGASGATAGDGSASAKWQGGAGSLDIKAAAARKTGTSTTAPGATGLNVNKVLLPGEKFQIYSQARVFSTLTTTSVGTDQIPNDSSGANVTNTSKNGTAHVTDKGRITTTTTSVLRARFSISVEFDPSVGFNNFTGTDYMTNYPKQSVQYTGARATSAGPADAEQPAMTWQSALGATEFKKTSSSVAGAGEEAVGTVNYPANSRRDAVDNGDKYNIKFTNALSGADLSAIKAGTKKSIYSWKFVSKSVYDKSCALAADPKDNNIDTTSATYKNYAKMGAPFDGTVNAAGEDSNQVDGGSGNGFYGVWILESAGENKANIKESDSFFKARSNAYIDSYVEEYITEYGEVKTRTIGESLQALENSLNQSFVSLVNDSSDRIIAGYVNGMTVSDNGDIIYAEDTTTSLKKPTSASWLYIDPTIGNDTNTNELSTGTGGWWYLVACNNDGVKAGSNKVDIEVDDTATTPGVNKPTETKAKFTRNDEGYSSKDATRLEAKLYEINPLINLAVPEVIGTNGSNNVTKVVSYAFPFVNGSSALPGDALTNVFANAKITFQISFQALQAFFPYSTTIDNMDYTNSLLGTAKALNIKNAIPIFNEAFDYQENIDNASIVGL